MLEVDEIDGFHHNGIDVTSGRDELVVSVGSTHLRIPSVRGKPAETLTVIVDGPVLEVCTGTSIAGAQLPAPAALARVPDQPWRHTVTPQIDPQAGTEPLQLTSDEGCAVARARPEVHHAPGPPTVKDVARIAGVSTATVSRVVNQNAHVSEAARTAVLHAITTLGYERNEAAASVRRMRNGR